MTETQMGLMRLENWRRWAYGGEVAEILRHYYPRRAAVAGQYVSSEVWDDDAHIPVDERDAELVERLIRNLPTHIRNAVRYRYTGRPRMIGTPDAWINDWVNQAAREIMAKKFHVVA